MSEVILNIPKEVSKDIRQFYDKYAGMLLGYIQGSIQDPKKSEEHLIKIITSFVLETKLDTESSPGTWMQLRKHAQNTLAQQKFNPSPLVVTSSGEISSNPEETSAILSAQENKIFKAVYYEGRSIACLAESLGEEENHIRIQLKSSMDKMRRLRGN